MPRLAFKVVVLPSGVYGPGYINPVPDDVAEEITNPAVWEKPDDEDGDEEGSSDTDEPADTEPSAPRQEAPAADQEALPEPPRSGTGSDLSAWRAFADSRGVQYPEDANRAAVIAACREAGVAS
jgi:hypothetical protein